MKFFKAIAKFFRDLAAEVKKVVWPSKKQVINNTVVVLVVCAISGAGLFVINSVFGFIIDLMTKGL